MVTDGRASHGAALSKTVGVGPPSFATCRDLCRHTIVTTSQGAPAGFEVLAAVNVRVAAGKILTPSRLARPVDVGAVVLR
jgi:hypothetical protein